MKEIYCLPGTMCDEHLWQFVQPLLSNITLKHIELPMEETIDGIVDSLNRLLPNKPVHLLGFSMGGYLASAFAIKYPARIKQLMVVSNAGIGLVESEIVQRKQALSWVLKHGYKGISKKKAMAMLGARNRNSDFLVRLIQDMDASLGERVLVQQLSSTLERPSLLSNLAGLSEVLCFCLGEEDTLVSAETIQSYGFHFHQAKQCGHMVPLEQPLWLAKKITAFF